MANFLDLIDTPISEYAEVLRRNGHPWIFQHIPKTAGTSVAQEMAIRLSPYFNLGAGRIDPNNPPDDGLSQVVEAFCDRHKVVNFRSASGHLRFHHVRRLRESIPRLRLFTVLRDPVDRVVSEYKYLEASNHPSHREHRAQYPSLESFASDPKQQNKMVLFLGGRPKLPAAGVDNLLKRSVFVGTLETLASDFAFITSISGFPIELNRRSNVTRSGTTKPQASVQEIDRDAIRDQNALDVELYERAVEVRTAIEDDLQTHVRLVRDSYQNPTGHPHSW